MKKKTTIGYLEGTDPMFLSYCTALGINTLPLSNGWDSHGKYVGLLSPRDNLKLVVAPLHKLVAPVELTQKPSDFLLACTVHHIPVLVVAPAAVLAQARKLLVGVKARLVWSAPEELFEKALAALKS
ncbi:MAG: hypothetical protein R6X14_01480 [bacterium]